MRIIRNQRRAILVRPLPFLFNPRAGLLLFILGLEGVSRGDGAALEFGEEFGELGLWFVGLLDFGAVICADVIAVVVVVVGFDG